MTVESVAVAGIVAADVGNIAAESAAESVVEFVAVAGPATAAESAVVEFVAVGSAVGSVADAVEFALVRSALVRSAPVAGTVFRSLDMNRRSNPLLMAKADIFPRFGRERLVSTAIGLLTAIG